MTVYVPPLSRIAFVLYDVLGINHELAAFPRFATVDRDLIDRVIAEAGNFASKILSPTRISGDAGCRLIDGRVITPPGYAEAYRLFVEAGWPAMACDEEHGGQGLPMVLHSVMLELLNSANPAWSMFPGIAHGAYDCLRAHAASALKERYLPKIASGEWTTSMCLTEAQAGSDLGLVRTRAEPDGTGAYRISGSKIFISGGDHDLAENIVHLVLARLPGSPVGSKGLSLFLVPKHLPDGSQGLKKAVNGIAVVGLEHKMGIRGSPTCALAFDDAHGWLIGEPNAGLTCMFVMMNAARLGVGVQALGASELAYQCSLQYARDRLQGRSAVGERGKAAHPLILQADVRRMLLTQKAWTEGARLISYWLSLQLDIAHAHPDARAREAASRRLSLLTPVAKAFLSDNAFEVANLAVQIYGGHGYMTEHGVEQIVRDVRVFAIYEGTNGVQAFDLLSRKVLADHGRALELLFEEMKSSLSATGSTAVVAAMLSLWFKLAEDILHLVRDGIPGTAAGSVATHFLRALGHAVMGWRFIGATRTISSAEDARAYLATAQFYFAQLFPEAFYHLAVVRNGDPVSSPGDDVLFA
ncbi:MAG: acyl-CoA dehydrogenase [Hydrocarboniphaga sp.]|uniref:acyl-CoA dehydrogenase family protein n=1 Tax=Hydrocarboniphaga sp. TaxID=2033016 RepID=UPI00261126CA|nr:acyl-CoA dehydrogenase family protein [Hydrocarboniphaga sp.]MDB5967722.1 acyl-CoA dehydrogenase [Hydrocarboniphaga sp.]